MIAATSSKNLGFLPRALLLLIILDIPFPCDYHLRYDFGYAEVDALSGLQVSLTTFYLCALYWNWFLVFTVRGPREKVRRPSVNPWLLVYLAAVGLSCVIAISQLFATYELIILVQTLLLYIYVIKNVQSRSDVCFLTYSIITVMLAHALLMIALRGIGHTIQLGPFIARVDPAMRVAGTIGSPNTAASALSLILAPCLAVLIASSQGWQRKVAFVAFPACVAALVLTLSRGGWLAACLSVTLFVLLIWQRGWLPSWLTISIGSFGILSMCLFAPLISARLLNPENSPLSTRLELIRLAGRISADHPLLGIGANNFALAMPDYLRYPDAVGGWYHIVHNKYMLVLAENGVVGLVAYVGFLLTTIRLGWLTWGSSDRLIASLGLGFALGVAGHMCHMQLDLFNTRPQVQLLWLVAALLTALHSLATRFSEEQTEETRVDSLCSVGV